VVRAVGGGQVPELLRRQLVHRSVEAVKARARTEPGKPGGHQALVARHNRPDPYPAAVPQREIEWLHFLTS
jgi:hypothetical protein